MNIFSTISQSTKFLSLSLPSASRILINDRNGYFVRCYAKKSSDECREAITDMPPEVDPKCPLKCERRKKSKGILHKIKLKVIEGGTNFGTPFRRLQCNKLMKKEDVKKIEPKLEPIALPAPEKKLIPIPEERPGLQVSILGADTSIGHYVALLLKQCPCIKKLRLYEAKDTECSKCPRDICKVVYDLQHIDTNCGVQAFTCGGVELERCLQNTDIVLMLESGYVNADMPFEKRFTHQAPIVKHYADVISTECPKAFVIVCASPIDCMVPLVSETMKETGWYDSRRVLGSLAVQEMRASTLAARALCLEPRYTKVPCVGGTEGEALVPLFSKAVEYFDFAKHNAAMMTDTVRGAPEAVARSDGVCMRAADLSEAHALAGLVSKVAYGLLCQDVPRVSGFVETDPSHVISPARYLSTEVLIGNKGICKKFDIPSKLNSLEMELLDLAFLRMLYNTSLAVNWHMQYVDDQRVNCRMMARTQFAEPQHYDKLDECAVHLT